MAIDAGIYQNFLRPVKSIQDFDNEAMAAQGNALQLQQQKMQMNALQQQQQDDQSLRNYLAGGANLSTPEGAAGLYRVAPKAAGGILKSQAEIAQANAATKKDQEQGSKAAQEKIGEAIKNSRIGLEGVTTPEQYLAWHQNNHTDPVLGAYLDSRGVTVDSARAKIDQALKTPGGFEKLLAESKVGAEKAFDQVMKQQEFGLKQNQFGETVRHNKSTEGTAAGQLSVARQRLTLDQQAPKGQYDAERGVLVDPRTGEARPVTMDGQPLGAKDKPLNDSQSKALLFGSRMQVANKVLADLEKTGTSASVPGSRTPIIGGIISAAQGANQQSLDQAKRDFMTAILRRESGASISPTEFDTADKQYFPQIGDSKQVIAQKSSNRKLAIDGVLIEVPEKARGSLSKPPQQSGPKPGAVEDGHRFKGGDPSNPSNWEKVK